MPPAPIGETISYEPSLAPEVSGIAADYRLDDILSNAGRILPA
jgi:hypothetical protein